MAKFNLHKIRNVPRDVCTAEQKIAYNLAFGCHISYQDEFDRVKASGTQAAISEGISRMIRQALHDYQNAYTYTPGKYDLDAIFHALRAGLLEYMNRPRILSSYEAIGQAFPILYN